MNSFSRRSALGLIVGGAAGLYLSQLPLASIANAATPSYTTDFSKWKVVASHTSSFRGSEPYRVTNIIVGSNAIDKWFWERGPNSLILPDEEFSLNSVLDGQDYVDGWAIGSDLKPELVSGGGICQIPTTIFPAALKAGFVYG
ncbi:MAG: VanW family protein [Candidatus Aenigmarchaeota archaeon]|nr:VanW family protein [Candidatus Aenigmarchaeota archaeon]